MFLPLPEKINASYIAQMNKTLYSKTVSQELRGLAKSLSQLEKRKIYLHRPLTVITAGIAPDNEEGREWKQLQEKLLLKSNQARQVIAEHSDHMINHHQPQIIVDAIRQIINR